MDKCTIEKGLIMQELTEVIDRNNGKLYQEVPAKIVEVSETEIMRIVNKII